MNLRTTRAWMREQAALLIVVAGLVVAFAYLFVERDRWWRPAGVIAAVVLLAGVLRLALPTDRVGALAVRSRGVDAATCLLLGGLLLALDIRLYP